MTQPIPLTLEAAIDSVVDQLDPESLKIVKDPTSKPGQTHFFGGMAIRNMWLHPVGSPLLQHFKTRFGLGCADDASGMILSGVWAKVRGQVYDADKDAEHYHAFWKRQGRSSLDQHLLSSEPPRDRFKGTFLDRMGGFWSGLLGAH